MTFPQWTTEISESGIVTGEDQLGLEAPALAYQQKLVPGINTVTTHARYYSFYAWVIWRYITDPRSDRTRAGFRKNYYRRLELALALSATLHHYGKDSFSGVTGVGSSYTKTRTYWEGESIASLDHNYFANREGGFGQYYHNAMFMMGIIDFPENEKLIYQLQERGESLAKAYEGSVQDSAFIKRITADGLSDTISAEEANEFAMMGCLCPSTIAIGKDYELLLDTFFRFDAPADIGNGHFRRRNALGVALDLVKHYDGQFTDTMVHHVLYFREYAPNTPYHPTPQLEEWAYRWQMIEIRHYFTFGLQCLWASFLIDLRSDIRISLDKVEERIESRLSKRSWNVAFSEFAVALCLEAGIESNYPELLERSKELYTLAVPGNEKEIYELGRSNLNDAEILFEVGIKILTLHFLRNYKDFKKNTPLWNELANDGKISINGFYNHIDTHHRNITWSMLDFLRWVYKENILDQHEMVALEKLRYNHYDTFKVYNDEGEYHLPVRENNYQERPWLASNRLSNCLNNMIDLGLIVIAEDKMLTLTSKGNEYHALVVEGLKA